PIERSSAGAASAGGRGSAGGTEHVVKVKETLSQIAHECGVTVEALMAANGLKNANMVRVGQRLIIPR
ncbi:MAG: LysM domain-containing protein, partial [bacterium]